MHEENLSENRARKKSARDKTAMSLFKTAMSLFIIFLKIDYVKDLLKKSNCDIL